MIRRFALFLGCLILLQLASPATAAFISFSDLAKEAQADAALGIAITPTGPADLPFVQGGAEVLGTSSPIDDNVNEARLYSGIATFRNPIKSLTLQAARVNNSGWGNTITLTALDDGKVVDRTTVNLPPLGDWASITLSAPSVDKIEWNGPGWLFHPYVVSNLKFTFAATPSVTDSRGGLSSSSPAPDLSSPAPEPGTGGIVAIAGSAALLRRTRRARRVDR